MRFLLVQVLFGLLMPTLARAEPNPYCVAGGDWRAGRVMDLLDMPGSASDETGSLTYQWGTLREMNIVNMVRPCKVLADHAAHGYHEDTDTICDPVVFGDWVVANPGKIWLIGNEPNTYTQDGLTPAQYARMFHRYFQFIKTEGRDLNARFATAGLVASASTDSLNANIAWWNQALGEYETQFGEPMPINIWAAHFYDKPGRLDPDRMIAEYLLPFRDYTRTVRDGVYEQTEFWITEFSVEVWNIPLHPDLIHEFMQQICPRLESAQIDRFF